jgi:ParB-like chromosome segregation protein Spo0J
MATRYVLVDGERRWRAASIVGLNTLKAIVLAARPSAIELLKIRAGLDFHSERLTWGERIDLACGLQAATNCNVCELAAMLNISQSLATKLTRTHTVAPQVRKALEDSLIDFEKAYILSAQPDHAKQLELLGHARGLSREHLRQTTRSGGQDVQLKTSIARFALPAGVVVTVQAQRKLAVPDAIKALSQTLKELKMGQDSSFDIVTVMRVMADRSRATP